MRTKVRNHRSCTANTPRPSRRNILLCLVAPLLVALPVAPSTTATGRFEAYCDGVGIFLSKIDGVPAPGKLVLFSYLNFPPGTMGGSYLGEGSGLTFLSIATGVSRMASAKVSPKAKYGLTHGMRQKPEACRQRPSQASTKLT